MVSIVSVRAYNDWLTEENRLLTEQIKSNKQKTDHWKMLSELFLDEINKARIRYGCENKK